MFLGLAASQPRLTESAVAVVQQESIFFNVISSRHKKGYLGRRRLFATVWGYRRLSRPSDGRTLVEVAPVAFTRLLLYCIHVVTAVLQIFSPVDKNTLS